MIIKFILLNIFLVWLVGFSLWLYIMRSTERAITQFGSAFHAGVDIAEANQGLLPAYVNNGTHPVATATTQPVVGSATTTTQPVVGSAIATNGPPVVAGSATSAVPQPISSTNASSLSTVSPVLSA